MRIITWTFLVENWLLSERNILDGNNTRIAPVWIIKICFSSDLQSENIKQNWNNMKQFYGLGIMLDFICFTLATYLTFCICATWFFIRINVQCKCMYTWDGMDLWFVSLLFILLFTIFKEIFLFNYRMKSWKGESKFIQTQNSVWQLREY